MNFSLRFFLTITIGMAFLITGNANAQQSQMAGVYQRSAPEYRSTNRRPRSYQPPRIARHSQDLMPHSVLNSSQFAEQPSNYPIETMITAPGGVTAQGNGSAKADELASRLYQGQGLGYGYEGQHPCVTGDIFGVCREGLCDEWYGHCACLELTNSRSNCECTNARRAHWGLSDSVHGDCGSCSSCSNCTGEYDSYPESPVYQNGVGRIERSHVEMTPRSARSNQRRSVSEYFHPNRR
jgi:hypothetical protein